MENSFRNIIFLADSMGFGGSERTVQILLNNIKDIKVLILIGNEIKYELPKDVKVEYVLKKNYSGVTKVLLFPYILYKLYKIMKKYRGFKFVSFHFFSNILNVLLSKVINTKPYVSERQYSELYFGKRNLILKPILKIIYNNSYAIICNDEDIRQSLKKFYGVKTEIYVLNNLLDLSLLRERKDNIKDRKQKFRYITVGRLSNEKNTIDLINAFSILKNKNTELYIIGDGVNRFMLEELTKNLNLESRIIFIGHTNNVYDYLKSSDVFVFTSLNEGFPNVILEAMACGLPIISYKFKAGIKTILGENEYGILVDFKNVKKIAFEMNRIYEDKKLLLHYSEKSSERIRFFTNKEVYLNKFKNILSDAK